ncbi:hypothetical protein ACJMK2_014928 [Sinanodonta woodiana]|uniref:TIR domain-containing protein n=1 Tax=Sinanodonta woodiana TaxID=1069815 RepID=A0ABD3V4T7_SINWO
MAMSWDDPIDEDSSSNSLQEAINDKTKSNLSTDQTVGQSDTEYQALSQVEEDGEDDLVRLNEDTQQETILPDQGKSSRKTSPIRLLNKAIRTFKKSFSSETKYIKWTEELLNLLNEIETIFFEVVNIGPSEVNVLNEYRQEACKQLSTTQSVPLMCNVVMQGWQTCAKQLVSNAAELPYITTLVAISVLWNFSDCSPEVTFDIIKESAFLKTLKEILTSYLYERIHGEEMNKDVSGIIGASLSIIHNLSKVDANITPIREAGFVNYVSPYLVSKVELDRIKALATLANLIDEKESEILLQGKNKLLKMFLENLVEALKAPNHRCEVHNVTWSALEITLTIHQLARNHANKPLLVQMGCLDHLMHLAEIGTTEEIREAVGAIWYLAFDKNNQIQMLEDKEMNIEDRLNAIRTKSKDKTTVDTIDGTLWLLNEKIEDKVRFSEKQKGSSDVIDTKTKKGHIMISYSWNHQEVLIRIRDVLKSNGYPVWMDIEHMGGSTVAAMAEAVEKSHVVLICMSQQYKESQNCEKEAEYAFQLKKEVVALKMEPNYKPNGWLGFIVGADLFYDFGGKYIFKTKCEELLKRMAVLYGEDSSKTIDDAVSFTPWSVARASDQSSLPKLREWTQKQVNEWLDLYHLPKLRSISIDVWNRS